MTIESALTALNTDIQNARTAITNKGGTVTSGGGSSQLATDIATIPTASSPVITSLSVTPTTSAQTITAPSGTDGYSPVNVSAVTSSIDANITAGNIKKDVQILGVTGTYEGSGGGCGTPLNYQILYDSSILQGDFVAPTFTKLVEYGYVPCIEVLGNIISPHQTSITMSSSLVMSTDGKPQLKEVHLDALETVTGANVFQTSFQDCTNLITLTFSNLATASATHCFGQMCKNCTSLTTVSFDKLSTLSGSYAFGGTNSVGGAFNGCTSLATLSFPSLTSNSFGSSTNQFNMMLKGVTGCTVHFPSNLQSVIGSWSSVTSGFGGTNTTVLFDLSATS